VGPVLGQQYWNSPSSAWFVTVHVASAMSTQDTDQAILFLFLTGMSVLLRAPARGQAPWTPAATQMQNKMVLLWIALGFTASDSHPL